MVLTKTLKGFVGKRDEREQEINNLLEKALAGESENGFKVREYVTQAISKKEEIEKERGTIYFEKYPEIPEKINKAINYLIDNGER